MIFNRFNKIVQEHELKGDKIDEILLFNSLKEAFINNVSAQVIHGTVGMVEFENPNKSLSKPILKCEAGDLLIIVFNDVGIRYSLMQNKTQHKNDHYSGTDPFYSPVRQHYLLSTKPLIQPIKSYSHLTPEILSGARMDSVGSFGVFYRRKDKSSSEVSYDMNYMTASDLCFDKSITDDDYCKNKQSKLSFKGVLNTIVSKGHGDEVSGCSNLINFEYHLRNMIIGQPVLKENFSTSNLIAYVREIIKSQENPIINNIFLDQSLDNQIINNFLELTEDAREFSLYKADISTKNKKYVERRNPSIVLIRANGE